MWPYWLLFVLPASLAFALSISLPTEYRGGRWPASWLLAFVFIFLMVGLRHEVGGDWGNYQGHIDKMYGQPLSVIFEKGEPLYGLLNWLGANIGGDQYLPNSICAFIFSAGLVTFCRVQPRPWLALTVAVPYLITVLGMGYTRQGVAVGTAMFGLTALSRGGYLRYGFWTGIGALFHKSAVVLVPIVFLANSRQRALSLILMGVMALLLYFFLFRDSADTYVQNYVQTQMASSGAAIRIAMTALPALVFLLARERFELEPAELALWTWMAGFALFFVVLLKVVPSSTAVDRVALYWIPLQLFVWSRIPDAFGVPGGRNEDLNLAVILYSATVHFVWLNFAEHALYWLPYRWYPWVAIFGD